MEEQVPPVDFRESLLHPPLPPPALPGPLHHSAPAGCPFLGILFEILKALANPLLAAPQVARPSRGWRLPPLRISPAQLPFEKELGAPVPTCWGPSVPSVQGCKGKKLCPLRGSEWEMVGIGDWEMPSEPGLGCSLL